MYRENFKSIGWKIVSKKALKKAIELNVPKGVLQNISARTRETEILEWRNTIMMCYWLNGETLDVSAKIMGRTHGTFVNTVKNVMKEVEGYDTKSKYIERIRLINYYAVNRVPNAPEENESVMKETNPNLFEAMQNLKKEAERLGLTVVINFEEK